MIILLWIAAAAISLPVSGIVVAGWLSLALLFGIARPTEDQCVGVLLAGLVLSQIVATALVGLAVLQDRGGTGVMPPPPPRAKSKQST